MRTTPSLPDRLAAYARLTAAQVQAGEARPLWTALTRPSSTRLALAANAAADVLDAVTLPDAPNPARTWAQHVTVPPHLWALGLGRAAASSMAHPGWPPALSISTPDRDVTLVEVIGELGSLPTRVEGVPHPQDLRAVIDGRLETEAMLAMTSLASMPLCTVPAA